MIKNNIVYFNEVQIIKWGDKEKVKELDLRKSHMPNGYTGKLNNLPLSEQIIPMFIKIKDDVVK